MFQNETPNSFYNAKLKIDIAIESYLVGVCLSLIVTMQWSSNWIEVKLVSTGSDWRL